MADIMEKAKELGMMIADSAEFKTLKAAENAQLDDRAAVELMVEYQNTRKALNERAAKEDVTKEEFEKIQAEATAAFQKIMGNEHIAAYVNAQQAFSNMMNQINGVLSYYVTGQTEGGCSGSCSSCSGCH